MLTRKAWWQTFCLAMSMMGLAWLLPDDYAVAPLVVAILLWVILFVHSVRQYQDRGKR